MRVEFQLATVTTLRANSKFDNRFQPVFKPTGSRRSHY
jgi:hypothetical protein